MHTDLSRRITQLIADAADTTHPAAIKADLLDLAKACQIAPGSAFLLRTIAGQLEEAVAAVFGPLALILVISEPARRQVWFAVLAALCADDRLAHATRDAAARADLLTRLVTARNADLVTWACGACPPAYLRLLSRLGDCALAPQYYTDLFALLRESPDLAKPILAMTQGQPLDEDVLWLLCDLPRTPDGVQAAARFARKDDYLRFMRPYRAMTMLQAIRGDHLRRIAGGESFERLMEGLYLDLPFPPPVIALPGVTHVPDGRSLVRTAREFSNCLHGYVAEALDNKRQFYIWRAPGVPAVAFAIDSEAPFGWYLSEAKLAENGRLPHDLREELHRMLADCSIRTNGSVEKMLRPYRNEPDAFDFEGLFDLGEAA